MPGSDQGAQSRATRWTRLADPERLLVAEHSLAVGDVAGTEAPQELRLSFVTPIKAPWELKVWDQWEDQGHECADDRGSSVGRVILVALLALEQFFKAVAAEGKAFLRN